MKNRIKKAETEELRHFRIPTESREEFFTNQLQNIFIFPPLKIPLIPEILQFLGQKKLGTVNAYLYQRFGYSQ